jgi:hypothetical protein
MIHFLMFIKYLANVNLSYIIQKEASNSFINANFQNLINSGKDKFLFYCRIIR